MRHILFYSQPIDVPFFAQLQTELIHAEETRKIADWRKSNPFRKFIQNPPDIHKTRLPVSSLNYGFCLGVVFFIFKMLYSDQPDGGLFWAAEYNEYLSEPLFRRKKIEDKEQVEFNPLIDDFLILLLRTSQISFSKEELAHIDRLTSVFVSPSETRELSSKLGINEIRINTSKAILESKKQLLQNLYEQWKQSILEFSLSSDILRPLPQESLDIRKFIKALRPKKIGRYNPLLLPLIFQGIHSIPGSFWFFIHHFAHINDPRNVCFPFLNKVMDLQMMNYERIQHKCMPRLEDLVTISPAFARTFEGDILKTNQVILYEMCVRSQSVKNPSFEEVCLFYRHELEIRLDRTNQTTINTIDSDIRAAMLRYSQPIIQAGNPYKLSYFLNITTNNRDNDDDDKSPVYGHIICCWAEISRMPSGIIQTNVFIFDPNNGLWKLDPGESVGAGIVYLIITEQMDSTRPELYADITFFRGL